MKRFILIAMMLAIASPVMAGNLWDLVKNSDLPTKQATAFQIEVKGVNTRIYVFHVPEMKSVCTQAFGDEVASQMECKTYTEMGLNRKEIDALPR